MMKSCATFETDRAHHYLERLCQHFGRRVDVQWEDGTAWVQFPIGRCEMTASSHQLDLVSSADTQERLDQVVQIVTNHLERYAFREHPELTWHSAPSTACQPSPCGPRSGDTS